jgi:hypothetical protein
MEQQRDFQEALHAILDEKYHALDPGTRGVGLFPHPVPYPLLAGNDKGYALRISECTKYNSGFPLNDVVIASCRHSYHPWCATLHFRNSNTCAVWACTTVAALEWVKSFGFCEFDGDMAAKEIEDDCEDARKSNLQERKDHAIATCQSIGRSAEFLDFITMLGKLFL